MDDVDISPITEECIRSAGLESLMHSGTWWMWHVHEMLVLVTGRKGRTAKTIKCGWNNDTIRTGPVRKGCGGEGVQYQRWMVGGLEIQERQNFGALGPKWPFLCEK